jgi:DNA-binding MarR family transcriptional regulator
MKMVMKKFEMLNIICNNCSLTAKEVLVAHYFVYKSNKSGTCYPAVDTIAKHCGVSERSVQRATKKLQERGYITISKRDINGRQTSNEYKLIIAQSLTAKDENDILEIESEKVLVQIPVISLEEFLMTEDNNEIKQNDIISNQEDVLTLILGESIDECVNGATDLNSLVCTKKIIVSYSDEERHAKGRILNRYIIIVRVQAVEWLILRLKTINDYNMIYVNIYRILLIETERYYKLILYFYNIHSSRFFYAQFRGVTMTPKLYNKRYRYGKESIINIL